MNIRYKLSSIATCYWTIKVYRNNERKIVWEELVLNSFSIEMVGENGLLVKGYPVGEPNRPFYLECEAYTVWGILAHNYGVLLPEVDKERIRNQIWDQPYVYGER